MSHLNVEIKARCEDPGRIRDILIAHKARFEGKDHQVDTYFNSREGRLKLREGTIENALIHYRRDNISGPKTSRVILFPTERRSRLKDILERANEVLCVVDKQREIFFIDNVKFHIDRVEGLGSFVEIEAIDLDGSRGRMPYVNNASTG